MALKSKFLWIVNMNTEAVETSFSKHALAMNATGVCIRTSSKRLPDTIKRFHDLGLKVYAWRWPPASAAGAQKEADFVANKLIPKGLYGYIAYPDTDQSGAANDWNRPSRAPFAQPFCSTITTPPPPPSSCAPPPADPY